MAIKGYFRSLGAYESNSMNGFAKRAKLGDLKSIDVIIEYLYFQKPEEKPIGDAQKSNPEVKKTSRMSAFGDVETRITYEAKPKGYTTLKTRFIKIYKNQHDALECTEKKINWLKNKLPGVEITIRNSDRQDVGHVYNLMLKNIYKNPSADKIN